MIGFKVSSHSEYKVKNGLSAPNSLEIWNRIYIVFDEWKDILVYTVYVPEYTSGRKNSIFGPRLEGEGEGDNKFSVLFKGGTENFYSSLWGTDVFSGYVSSFRNPPAGNK